METKTTETTLLNSVNEETNLPEVMASLERLTVTANSSSNVIVRRSLRKRIARKDVPVTANRRCSQKPRKRGHSEMETETDIREYYLDKSLKLTPNKLETISEERKGTGESHVYIGAKKFKRMIEFQTQPTASKIKKRRNKVRRIFGASAFGRKTFTMEVLFDKLKSMQPESSPEFDGEDKEFP